MRIESRKQFETPPSGLIPRVFSSTPTGVRSLPGIFIRWYRYAQPPANGYEPFGFSERLLGKGLNGAHFSIPFVVFLLATLFCATPGHAEEPAQEKGLSPAQLNHTIEEVLQRREYAWRMPREKTEEEPDAGLLGRFFAAISKLLKRAGRAVIDALKWLIEHLFPREAPDADPAIAASAARLRILVYVLVVCVALAAVVLLWRRWPRPTLITAAVPVAAAAVNPADENVRADQLPADEWMTLAADYAQKGDFRLALRTVYLGTLAALGERELIVLARFKSNQEYLLELERRAHSGVQAPEVFRATVGLFECTWYGQHLATAEMLQAARGNFERLAT